MSRSGRLGTSSLVVIMDTGMILNEAVAALKSNNTARMRECATLIQLVLDYDNFGDKCLDGKVFDEIKTFYITNVERVNNRCAAKVIDSVLSTVDEDEKVNKSAWILNQIMTLLNNFAAIENECELDVSVYDFKFSSSVKKIEDKLRIRGFTLTPESFKVLLSEFRSTLSLRETLIPSETVYYYQPLVKLFFLFFVKNI
ncbi:p22 [Pineapple mealybug wilt-associated virus 6]|nr:p22 [Pineapple mealybug wilt-associated virus 6]WCR39369.1 p23 [Pineapple mealybug wilt-associated virus 6]